jgi:hypothetical protein
MVSSRECPVTGHTPAITYTHVGKQYDLLTCTTSIFYHGLVNKYSCEPAAYRYWNEHFTDIVWCKVWSAVHLPFKPPDCLDLDYKVCHNGIFTYKKLFQISKVDDDLCPLCKQDEEDLFHMFVDCIELKDFVEHVTRNLESLFRSVQVDYLNHVSVSKLMLLGFHEHTSKANYYFINYFLSLARLCIFKRRQIYIMSEKRIHIEAFFNFAIKKYINYAYFYYSSKHKLQLFEKYFVVNNPLLKMTGNQVVIRL